MNCKYCKKEYKNYKWLIKHKDICKAKPAFTKQELYFLSIVYNDMLEAMEYEDIYNNKDLPLEARNLIDVSFKRELLFCEDVNLEWMKKNIWLLNMEHLECYKEKVKMLLKF